MHELRAKIHLINPRFEVSYWGLEYVMPLLGKKANLPTACLQLLAALTPSDYEILLSDENVDDLDFDQLAQADIVGLTGMSVQRGRMIEILKELRRRDCFTVVGGPWVTVREDYFGELADVIFVGEADLAWPQFLSEWSSGRFQKRYEQSDKTDMTTLPCPRYDLIDANNYVFGSLQISRGCPYECEFCDIIVTFGRRPRLKTAAQVLVELDAMQSAGLQIAFIVDDNLIGNKKAIKPILREIVRWQEANGFALTFFAEASIDLADDEELMAMFVAANVQAVFIGVETPNTESLRETKKLQNLRTGGTLTEKLLRVQDRGIEAWTGMILGFDNDDLSIFDAQVDFVREARVTHAMCGMLSAIPKTPLYERLRQEGRLDESDESTFGTNVVPKQMTRTELLNGYRRVMHELNDVHAFFDRADSLYLDPSFQFDKARRSYLSKHPVRQITNRLQTTLRCLVLYLRLMGHVEDRVLRAEYRRRVWGLLQRRPQVSALFVYLIKCATHYHYHRVTRSLNDRSRPLINTF